MYADPDDGFRPAWRLVLTSGGGAPSHRPAGPLPILALHLRPSAYMGSPGEPEVLCRPIELALGCFLVEYVE